MSEKQEKKAKRARRVVKKYNGYWRKAIKALRGDVLRALKKDVNDCLKSCNCLGDYESLASTLTAFPKFEVKKTPKRFV